MLIKLLIAYVTSGFS